MAGMLRTYGLFGFFRLLLYVVHTRLFFRGARIIRFPVFMKNRYAIRWGRGFTTGVACRLEAYPLTKGTVLHIGTGVQMNDYVHITAMQNVWIGNDVLMASRIYISDSTHGSYKGDPATDSDPSQPPQSREYSVLPVRILDRVWLGEGVCVLPGVTIGEGCIVGANSVVTRDLPANCVAVGSPARPIKKYDFQTKRWVNLEQKQA
jgi:acetyltransferase-like isoleucine patch superfamily enzyme